MQLVLMSFRRSRARPVTLNRRSYNLIVFLVSTASSKKEAT